LNAQELPFDARHNQTNLVHVSGEHQGGARRLSITDSKSYQVPQAIRSDLIDQGCPKLLNVFSDAVLPSGGSSCLRQFS
jgi:hypothetical protein